MHTQGQWLAHSGCSMPGGSFPLPVSTSLRSKGRTKRDQVAPLQNYDGMIGFCVLSPLRPPRHRPPTSLDFTTPLNVFLRGHTNTAQRGPTENGPGHGLGRQSSRAWTKYFPSLNLSSLICKMGLIPPTMQVETSHPLPPTHVRGHWQWAWSQGSGLGKVGDGTLGICLKTAAPV